jgi:hypothetical protein
MSKLIEFYKFFINGWDWNCKIGTKILIGLLSLPIFYFTCISSGLIVASVLHISIKTGYKKNEEQFCLKNSSSTDEKRCKMDVCAINSNKNIFLYCFFWGFLPTFMLGFVIYTMLTVCVYFMRKRMLDE